MIPRVIIIEDEIDIRTYLMAVLADAGFDVQLVDENASIVDAVLRYRPDVIILDIMMPRRSGLSIYVEMRSCEELKAIPVALMSGVMSAVEDPADEFRNLIENNKVPLPECFIEKPVKPAVLVDTINRMLAKRNDDRGATSQANQ